MKKIILTTTLILASVSMVACSPVKEKKNTESSTSQSSSIEETTNSSSEVIKEEAAVKYASPAEAPYIYPVPEKHRMPKGFESYVGYWELDTPGDMIHLQINTDGSYTLTEETVSSNTSDVKVYFDNQQQPKFTDRKKIIKTGYLEEDGSNITLGYGNEQVSLEQSYLDENGQVMNVYKELDIPSTHMLDLKNGTIYHKSSYMNTPLTKKETPTEDVKYSAYQILLYSKGMDKENKIYKFNNFNEFVQASTNGNARTYSTKDRNGKDHYKFQSMVDFVSAVSNYKDLNTESRTNLYDYTKLKIDFYSDEKVGDMIYSFISPEKIDVDTSTLMVYDGKQVFYGTEVGSTFEMDPLSSESVPVHEFIPYLVIPSKHSLY